jgi:cell division septation protein DedD
MTQQERRQYGRKTLNPLPYINLPSGNGGIILDVSEQGLRFRALAPLEQSGPIEFSFTAQANLVSGTGELVWIDRAKKMGGLRFTDLPYFALEQIRRLPSNSNLRPGFGKDLTLHIPAPDASQPGSAIRRGAFAGLASRFVFALNGILPRPFGSRLQPRPIPFLRNGLGKLRALAANAGHSNDRRRLIQASCAALFGIAVLTLVIVRHRQAGELLVRMGTRLSGEAAASVPVPVVIPPSPRVDDGLVEQAKAAEPVAQPLPQPVKAAPAEPAREISAPASAPPVPETPVRLPKISTARGELVVQVAALTQESDARELTDKLRKENFQAYVGTFPADSFYRVMLGPYPDAASALDVRGKLKKAGFNSFIRRESAGERAGSLGKAAPRQEPAT